MLKFLYPEDKLPSLSQDDLKEFITKYKNYELSPYFRSSDKVKSNGETVLSLVGKDFIERTKVEGLDTFVNFYSNDCKTCIEIKEIWEQFAEQVKDYPNLKIAKFDV